MASSRRNRHCPNLVQDLEAFEAIWIRIFYARHAHQSDENHVINISQRLERKRQYSDSFTISPHYRVINFFDRAI